MVFLKEFINKLKNNCKIRGGTFVSDTGDTLIPILSVQ